MQDYRLVVDVQTGQGLEVRMRIDYNLKHKIRFLVTNKTNFEIYQIDLKFNKNYLGFQSLKTLLDRDDILKVNESKVIIIPLKLIEKSQQDIAANAQSMSAQAAIRYFKQYRNVSDGKYMSQQSDVIFFNISIPPFIFFNQFRDDTVNESNYFDKVSGMKSVSRKCRLNITVNDDDDDTELIIDDALVKALQCKRLNESKQPNETRMIYMALLQFKWVVIGICIHKNAQNAKNVAVDIVSKSHNKWQSEAAMQAAKFAVLSQKNFLCCMDINK